MASDDEIVMEIDENFLIETNKKILLREKERTGKKVHIETFLKILFWYSIK